jgi:hypothetical protein
VLCDWHLLLSWAQQGKAQEHFGEVGVTNLLHLLRDALCKATGAPLLGGAHGQADHLRSKAPSRERQQAQGAARQDATLALMKELPALLRKVQTDPTQVRARQGRGLGRACQGLALLGRTTQKQQAAHTHSLTHLHPPFLRQHVPNAHYTPSAACRRLPWWAPSLR